MAEFRLPPGATTQAVRHRSVEELWFVASGTGELWRRGGSGDSVSSLTPGVALSIDPGTAFQFRNTGLADLRIVGVTMPPWPGEDEAESVSGYWPAD